MYGRSPDVSKSPEKIPTDDAYPGTKIVAGPSKGLFNSLHSDFLPRDLEATRCSSGAAGPERELLGDITTNNWFEGAPTVTSCVVHSNTVL